MRLPFTLQPAEKPSEDLSHPSLGTELVVVVVGFVVDELLEVVVVPPCPPP